MLLSFKEDISHIPLPEKFTFPFFYEPHPLVLVAAKELQNYLQTQEDFKHNFGLDRNKDGLVIGKMFGVLVVKNADNELGYLRAFSGKLANVNHHKGFVPPVFDMLRERSFFRLEEEELNALNRQIETLEGDKTYLSKIQIFENEVEQAKNRIQEVKDKYKSGKKDRKRLREHAKLTINARAYRELDEQLKKESIKSSYWLKDQTALWKAKEKSALEKLEMLKKTVEQLKKQRRLRSAALQDRLFANYSFLNANGEQKSLLELFKASPLGRPPAGAGECAAPKLLHFAFENNLEPLAIAEFWWGASPSAEVRKSGYFYPACNGKCKPILGHMLEGLNVEEDPFKQAYQGGKNIETIYEDEDIIVINKPEELLSVPGKLINDSVITRLQNKYDDSEGPFIVHRLDMSTSGIMVLGKKKKAHHLLQKQFIQRQVKKRYVALLDGVLEDSAGSIELPLRVDLDDRPRQLVCYEHGKMGITAWKRIVVENQKTRIHFYPQTGRTHQLRVHAAHKDGLNIPILGDDLYGKKGSRLHLHAEELGFLHPSTKEWVTFSTPAPF